MSAEKYSWEHYSSPIEDLRKIFDEIVRDLSADLSVDLAKKLPQRAFSIRCNVEKKHRGDLASEMAFSLAKFLKSSPIDVGKKVADALLKKSDFCEFVDVVPPGFINIGLKNDYFKAKLISFNRSLKDETFFPIIKNKEPRKTLLEYVSANPTGPLHVGHGRWAVVGSVLAKVLKAVGGEVFQEFYVNDGGVQIEALLKSVDEIRNDLPVSKDGYHGEYLLQFKNNSLNPVNALLEQQKEDLKSIEVVFDHFFHETELRKKNADKKIIDFLKKNKLAYEKDGALWFASTLGGDDKDRVLVKSDGSYTYFLVDIAYHATKMERGFFHLIDILGADHHGYVNRISTASRLISEKLFAKESEAAQSAERKSGATNQVEGLFSIDVLIGQQVMLFRSGKPVKMSKRAGEIITLNEVVREVGSDAFRYFMCAQSIGKRIDFDLELAKEKTMNNPVFYLQYAHARCCSLFKKAEAEKINSCNEDQFGDLLAEDRVRSIVNQMLNYGETLLSISKSFEVHHYPRFLYDISAQFHSLYASERFVDFSSEQSIKKSREYLFFVDCFRLFLKTGLALMDISAPQEMKRDEAELN